jgi:hypothetical protein
LTQVTRISRITHFDPGLRQLRLAVVAMAATLASYGSALALKHAEHLSLNLVILAVVLALSLSRTDRASGRHDRLLGIALLPTVAVASSEVGVLLIHHESIGDALFVLAISGSIWVRRFGHRFAKAGTLVALPFVALLITPVVSTSAQRQTHVLWAAVIGAIAYFWVSATKFLAERANFIQRAPEQPTAPALTPTPRPTTTTTPQRKLIASDRMAIQMAVALASAFALGRALFPTHWSWLVITAFIVSSGNRGRADVVYKSALRIAGAAVGTVAATLLAGALPAGDVTSVIAIFVILAIATWLRPFSYAYWAAGITSVLALLYGYFGETATAVLPHRLEGIALGAAIGIAASWLLLPVKTTDILRRRIATALAALSDLLNAITTDTPSQIALHAHRFEHAAMQLDEIAKLLEAHRFLIARRRTAPHAADALDATRSCRMPVRVIAAHISIEPTALANPRVAEQAIAVAAHVRRSRQALGGRPVESPTTLPTAPDHKTDHSTSPIERALTEIDQAMASFATAHTAITRAPRPHDPQADQPKAAAQH